jgi:hypothetical protein
MSLRARLFPVLALLLAVATAIAVTLTVALPGPAGAVVSANPDDSTCETNGRVNAVAYLGGTVYLGGSFSQVDGTTRNGLAACDAASGNLLTWNPNANGVVRALKVSPAGTRVYVGGDFSAVGGAARSRVAALSPSSGAAFGWNPYVNDQVKSITTSNSGSTVYAGGDFDSAEGAGRHHLAAFNATSGNLTSLKPTISNGTGNFATVLSMDVSADGNTLYFAGDFALVNGSSRRNAAAVPSGIGTLRAWSPSATADVVGDLTLSTSGRTVFVGGRSTGGYVQADGPTAGGSPVWNVGTNGDVEARPGDRLLDPVRGRPLHHRRRRPRPPGRPAGLRRQRRPLEPGRQRRLRRLRGGHHQLPGRLRSRVHHGQRRSPPGRRPVLRDP